MNRTLVIPTILAAVASPAVAADIQLQAQGPVVELSVTETVKAKPDLATVSAGVTSQAPTAVAAMQANAAAMDAVVKRIKALGIAGEDIQTEGVNLGAQYDYDQSERRQVFRGYQASNRVSVILRKVPDTGRVLDALVAAGATDISGPMFSIDDDTGPRAQARKAALEKARKQAEDYAKWAGYTGVRLLQVSESFNSGAPMPYAKMDMRAAASPPVSPTPVEPGLVGTSVSVNVTYEMTR
jgi:uncharacterized protein YggE